MIFGIQYRSTIPDIRSPDNPGLVWPILAGFMTNKDNCPKERSYKQIRKKSKLINKQKNGHTEVSLEWNNNSLIQEDGI